VTIVAVMWPGRRTQLSLANGAPVRIDGRSPNLRARHPGVRSDAMVETMPLEKAPEAYAKMMAGKARFRIVLTMQSYGY
jgi:hypothetical protein